MTQAVNVCNENIPSNRIVDGFPAYSQCNEVASGNVWSNNGVDTSTSSQGPDWVQTQRGGGYQCTEWAYRYMRFRFDVSYRSGDAKEWCDGKLPSTLVKSDKPMHGDLIVFDAGVCGSDSTTGHIAVIDEVNANASTVTFVEQNQAGRRTAKATCAKCFLHAVANDGSPAAGGAGGTAGGAAAEGGGPPLSGGSGGAGGSPPLGGGGVGAAGGRAGEPGGSAPIAGASTTLGGSAANAAGSASGGGLPGASNGGASGGSALPPAPSTGPSVASPPTEVEDSSGTCSLAGRPPARGPRELWWAALGLSLGLVWRRARREKRRP